MTCRIISPKNRLVCSKTLIATACLNAMVAFAAPEFIPTGMRITPTAAPTSVFQALNPDLPTRPDFTADHAVDMATSPDGKTLLVLTSGFNRNADSTGQGVPSESNEYVFVYDISGGNPVKKQVMQVPNTFNGIAWNPNGKEFYVSGGVDDNVHAYALSGSSWAESGTPIALGHDNKGEGLFIRPMAAGLSVNASGKYLMVTNYENDSVSLVDLATRTEVDEIDLRPGKLDPALKGKPGGTFPFAVKFIGDDKAYVSSQRDREILVLDVKGGKLALLKRIKTEGQPTKMTSTRDGSTLFVASDNDDSVVVLDTKAEKIVETIPTVAPKHLFRNYKGLRGVNPNNVALSDDEKTLLVTNGGTNSVAVIKLGTLLHRVDTSRRGFEPKPVWSEVVGLIPTGWYPSAVVAKGEMLYVVNSKGNTGPNPEGCRDTLSIAPDSLIPCRAANQYVWQMEKAGLLSLPMPNPTQLGKLSWQVAQNSNFPASKKDDHAENMEKMAKFLRQKINHVIYIVKENRTYDQVLGDLTIGNGDPTLAILAPFSPNHRKLALDYFTLDNFYDSGETSGVGWNWTTAARTNDSIEKTQPPNYAGRGLSYDWEGDNRNINVGLATVEKRMAYNPNMPNDPDLLAGTADIAAPDSSEGEVNAGYLWNAALRKGKTLRNYGFYVDNLGDSTAMTDEQLAHPFAAKLPQAVPTKKALAPYTDIYFRGYDQVNADFYLYKEWEREFDRYAAKGKLPNLSFIRFPHDHFGNFSTAKFGVNTVETQMADNDYAMGLVIEKIAHSPFKDNTLIFIIEDDAQNGGDHVDAHRSIAYIVGPYVKRHALISKPYTTVSFLHTMTEVLGLEPMGLNDGLSDFMDVFDPKQKDWHYEAIVPDVLYTTQLPLPARAVAVVDSNSQCQGQALRTASYWASTMQGLQFDVEDKLDVERFNLALWTGLKGEDVPYPSTRSGLDLRQNRENLLAKHQAAIKPACGAVVASR